MDTAATHASALNGQTLAAITMGNFLTSKSSGCLPLQAPASLLIPTIDTLLTRTKVRRILSNPALRRHPRHCPRTTHQNLEFLSKDDFTCFDLQGHKLMTTPNPSKVTGTPAYCRRYPCTSPQDARSFCEYSTPVTAYHHDNSSIIIKTWGTITRTYYPALEPFQKSSLPGYIILRCTIGGILIDTMEQFDMQFFACIYISNYSSNLKILLPSSIAIFQYTVKLTAWKKGKQIFQETKTCEGKPICEILDCFICWEHILNPHC